MLDYGSFQTTGYKTCQDISQVRALMANEYYYFHDGKIII